MSEACVISVNVGVAQPLDVGERQVMSGIAKRPVASRVAVRPLGLEGDEQADLSVHGGLAKAVYAYPSEHHAVWRTLRAQAGVAPWDAPVPPAAFGENLTLAGLLEADAWVGDVLRFPDCALVVSEPRFPCFKFNALMGFKHAAKMMAQSRTCGFYLAVREEGSIAAGERFTVEPGPREVRISELFAAKAHRIT
jgi:MOSC domain-containing protein YiiM